MSRISFWTSHDELSSLSLPDSIQNVYAKILPYVTKFLCAQHPYRRGPVCPFVPKALQNHNIFFTYLPASTEKNFQSFGVEFLENATTHFLKMKKKNPYGALIILCEHNQRVESLLDIHLAYKKKCVEQGLMLGVLWPDNNAPSIKSRAFYPLRTPTPIMVIRDLHAHDLLFLDPKYYRLKSRISFLNAFIAKFAHHKSQRVQNDVATAKVLCRKYQSKRVLRGVLVALSVVILSYFLGVAS